MQINKGDLSTKWAIIATYRAMVETIDSPKIQKPCDSKLEEENKNAHKIKPIHPAGVGNKVDILA